MTKRILYVGGLGSDVTDEDIYDLLVTCGGVLLSKRIVDTYTAFADHEKDFGVVVMATEQAALAAQLAFHRTELKGCELQVLYADAQLDQGPSASAEQQSGPLYRSDRIGALAGQQQESRKRTEALMHGLRRTVLGAMADEDPNAPFSNEQLEGLVGGDLAQKALEQFRLMKSPPPSGESE